MTRHTRAITGVVVGACLISAGFGLAVVAALVAHRLALALTVGGIGLIAMGAATVLLFGIVYDADDLQVDGSR